MRDCSGLDVVHSFIQIGYLQAKRETLACAVRTAEEREAAAQAALRELVDSKLQVVTWPVGLRRGRWAATWPVEILMIIATSV